MKLRNTILTTMLAVSLVAAAKPAKFGQFHTLSQSDGSEISLQIVGDEFGHYYLTDDNLVVLPSDNSFYYADMDALGNLYTSTVLAHNVGARGQLESNFVSQINAEKVRQMASMRDIAGMSRANNQDGKGTISSTFPVRGAVKSLVFLVAYSDVDFQTENPKDYFTRMLNEEGFSDYNGKGSVRDYYIDASCGIFTPEFDVYGPVVLPNPQSYYGENNAFGTDRRPKEMILHAAQQLDDIVDFSQYDLDGDKFVDNVYIFYAGHAESDGGGPNTVWPHQSEVGINVKYRFDGVQLNRYACGSELSGNKPDGIGTFTHEFGHVLGLPDLYNINDMSVNYTPLFWSVMDQGCYNGSGCQPPTFSAYERNALGWMGDNLVEIKDAASCRLEPIIDSNKAYLINTDNANEFFLFENRQKSGWDFTLPGHGMLIWHIDYDRRVFANNQANVNPDHQRVDIVEANNKVSSSALTQRRYSFGKGTYSNVDEFTFDTTPSFRTWSGLDLGLPITDIIETDGIITFNVAGGGDDPASSLRDIYASDDLSVRVDGRTITVESVGAILISDISGRVIASGVGEISADAAAPGLYIVSTPAGSKKLFVK